MRDVLGPLRPVRRTAILPFQYRRLARASRVVVESCPASTLKRLGLPHQNYKQPAGGRPMRKRRRTRHAILAGLTGLVGIDDARACASCANGGADALDAVLAGVGAWRCCANTTTRRSAATRATRARGGSTPERAHRRDRGGGRQAVRQSSEGDGALRR